MAAYEYDHANIMALETAPERCGRCGRTECDEVPPGYWDRLMRTIERAPFVQEDAGDDEVEPLL